jgi:hypothetical protein
MDALSVLDNSRSSINKYDIEGISKFIPAFNGVPTDETIDVLKSVKRKYEAMTRPMIASDKPVDPAERFKMTQDISALSYYIDKLSRASIKEVDREKTQVVVGADTRSTLRKAFDMQPQMSIQNENLGDEFFTGLEALKRKNTTKYDNIVNRLNSNKALASIEVAELINDGADIVNSRNAEKLRNNEINIDQYIEARDVTHKAVTDNLYSRPDILQRQ